MRLPDVNLLLYSVNERSPNHELAAKWLASAFGAIDGVGFAWIVLVGFVRLSTRQNVMPTPLALGDALALVDGWLRHPRAKIVNPGNRQPDIFARLLLTVGAGGNLTNDAHLAAIAMEHNGTVATFDKDFKKFPGLSLELLPSASVRP
jgi:uncharacterized protein